MTTSRTDHDLQRLCNAATDVIGNVHDQRDADHLTRHVMIIIGLEPPTPQDWPVFAAIAREHDRDLLHVAFDPRDDRDFVPTAVTLVVRGSTDVTVHPGCTLWTQTNKAPIQILTKGADQAYAIASGGAVERYPRPASIDIAAGTRRVARRLRKEADAGALPPQTVVVDMPLPPRP